MFVCRLLLGIISSIDFKIRSFSLINNSRHHDLNFPYVVARSGLDDLNIFVCIACH